MVKMCYICRRKASKRDRVSLFRFPKDPIARHKWMKACDLLPSDDLRGIHICSMHFSTKHVDRGNQFQTRCTLKVGAVPSIGVPNPICFDNENGYILNDGIKNNTETKMLKQTADSKETKIMPNDTGNALLMNVVRKCIACGSGYKKDGEMSFYPFPKDFETRKVWMNCLNLTSKDFSMTSNYVCAKHFSQDCYKLNNGKLTLKNNSIPKLFPKEKDVNVDIPKKVLINGNPGNVSSDVPKSNTSCTSSKNTINLVETIRTIWIPDKVTLVPTSPEPSNHLETKSTNLGEIITIDSDSKTSTTSHSSPARLTNSSPKVFKVTPSHNSRGNEHCPEKSSLKETLPGICENTKFQNHPQRKQSLEITSQHHEPRQVVVIKQTSQDEEPPQNIIFRPRLPNERQPQNGMSQQHLQEKPPLTLLPKQEELSQKKTIQNPERESALRAKETSQNEHQPPHTKAQNIFSSRGAPQIIIINTPSQGQMSQNNMPYLLPQGKDPPPLTLSSGGAALNGAIQQLTQGKGISQETLQQLIQNKEQPQNRIFQQLSLCSGPTQNRTCYLLPQKEAPPQKTVLLPAAQGKGSAESGTVYLLPQTEGPSPKTLLLVPQGNQPAQNRVVHPLPLSGTPPQNNMFYLLPQGEGQQQKTVLFQLLQGNVPAQNKPFQQFPVGQPQNIIIQPASRREEPSYNGTQNKTFYKPPQAKQSPQSRTFQHITQQEESQEKRNKTVKFQEPLIRESQKNIKETSVTHTIQERLQDERMPPQNESFHQIPMSNGQLQNETSQRFSNKEEHPQEIRTAYFQEPDKNELYRQIKKKYRCLVKKLLHKNMEIKRLQQRNRRYKIKIDNLNDIVGVLERKYKECINETRHRRNHT